MKAAIGTISEGTLRTEDLLTAFASELARLDTTGEWASLIADARADVESMDNPEYDPDCDLGDLIDALGTYAPPYCYFGTLEGDGAHFGFWPDMERLQEELRYQGVDLPSLGDEYRLLPDDGLIVHVSDHGNMMLYTLEIGQEVWSIV